jgi:hypothetical protein
MIHPAPASWAIRGGVAVALLATPLVARADGGPDHPAGGLLMLGAVVLLLAALGVALGCFGTAVSHLFRRRATLTLEVLLARPGWSLVAGIGVTLVGLALLAVLRPAPGLQLVVLLGWLAAFAMFGLAAATRLAGRIVDQHVMVDDLPPLRTLLVAGLLLAGLNAVPLLGTMLFAGIVLAAVGATLLGYFSRRTRGATAKTSATDAPATASSPRTGAPAEPGPPPAVAPADV